MVMSNSKIKKQIQKLNKLSRNQVNPNRYFVGYEDALRWVLREKEREAKNK